MIHTIKYKNSYIHISSWPNDGYKEHFIVTFPNYRTHEYYSMRAAKLAITKSEKAFVSLYGENVEDWK